MNNKPSVYHGTVQCRYDHKENAKSSGIKKKEKNGEDQGKQQHSRGNVSLRWQKWK